MSEYTVGDQVYVLPRSAVANPDKIPYYTEDMDERLSQTTPYEVKKVSEIARTGREYLRVEDDKGVEWSLLSEWVRPPEADAAIKTGLRVYIEKFGVDRVLTALEEVLE